MQLFKLGALAMTLAMTVIAGSASAESFMFYQKVKGMAKVEPEPAGPYLKVVNPKPGVDGIYQIDAGVGGKFDAYVDMTSDGGHWILVAHWVSGAATRYYSDVVTKGLPINSYTQNAGSYPVIPTGVQNTADRALFKSLNSTWRASYGDWQSFSTFSPGQVLPSEGFNALTSTGLTKPLFGSDAGWNNFYAVEASPFGLWTQRGNGGVCGGANVAGKPVCPGLRPYYGAHFDWSSVKQLYLKANQ